VLEEVDYFVLVRPEVLQEIRRDGVDWPEAESIATSF
jgi:hypothetical protein